MRTALRLVIPACLLFAALGCQLVGRISRRFSTGGLPDTGAATPALPQDDPGTAVASGLVLSSRELVEASDTAPKYQIEARWPVLEWGSDSRVDGFNKAVAAFVTEEMDRFKGDVRSMPPDPAFSGTVSSLQISYAVKSSANNVLSVLFDVSLFMAGAAHPAHFAHAFNYDLLAGSSLALADLFLPGAHYLEALSSTCLKSLAEQDVLAWEDGALPEAENYRVWNLTPGGLLITFNEYQVAPYAAGSQTVLIPFAYLEDLLLPNGPASR